MNTPNHTWLTSGRNVRKFIQEYSAHFLDCSANSYCRCQCAPMKLRKLEELLGSVEGFEAPKILLEQYETGEA